MTRYMRPCYIFVLPAAAVAVVGNDSPSHIVESMLSAWFSTGSPSAYSRTNCSKVESLTWRQVTFQHLDDVNLSLTSILNSSLRPTGTLCQIAPLSDGKCNVFFNGPEFAYDGGDWCQAQVGTLENQCGVVSVGSIPNIDIGLPHCIDPS